MCTSNIHVYTSIPVHTHVHKNAHTCAPTGDDILQHIFSLPVLGDRRVRPDKCQVREMDQPGFPHTRKRKRFHFIHAFVKNMVELLQTIYPGNTSRGRGNT